MGMLEVVAVLHRHRNAGRVTQSLFNTTYAHFMDMTFWLPQAEAALAQVSACDNTPAE
jgi:hypothetical protein